MEPLPEGFPFRNLQRQSLCAATGIAYLNVIATGRPTEDANRKARKLRTECRPNWIKGRSPVAFTTAIFPWSMLIWGNAISRGSATG